MKKYILVLVGVLVLIIGVVIIKNNNKSSTTKGSTENLKVQNSVQVQTSDGTKVNTSEALKNEKMLGNLKITNIELTTDTTGTTRLLADVENTGSEESNMKFIVITILDKDKNKLDEVNGLIVPLEAREKTQLNVNVTSEYKDAYDFLIEEKN